MIVAGGLSRAALRRQLRQARRALSPAQQKCASQLLYKQLIHNPQILRAKHIAVYLANDGEIDPRVILRVLQNRGKQVYLPVLRRWPKGKMDFQRFDLHEKLTRNRFRIAEPRQNRAKQRKPWALDLVLLPLVGFDEHGGRLGMGGGFYDRALAYKHRQLHLTKPALIGLAHECQKVDKLELASWDVRLNAVVTDHGWYR